MHISPIGQQATLWQAGLRPELEDLLRGAASGDVVYASMSAEPGHSILTDSSTIMTKVDGGYRVSGHKVFGTGSAVCTSFSTMGRYEDPVDGPQLMFFVLPRHSEGVIVHDTWDTMGMRATRSNEFDMEHVFIPEGAVFHSLPIDHYDATLIKTVWGWSMPVFGSVYLGIAAGAIEQLRKMVLKRHWEQRPEIQRVFADMEVLLETARAVIRAHAEDYESGRLYVDLSVQQAMSRARASQVRRHQQRRQDPRPRHAGCRGSGFFKPSPLERAYRDVRAGTVHPYNNFEALNLFGKTSLEIEIRPSVDAIDSPLIQRIVAASL